MSTKIKDIQLKIENNQKHQSDFNCFMFWVLIFVGLVSIISLFNPHFVTTLEEELNVIGVKEGSYVVIKSDTFEGYAIYYFDSSFEYDARTTSTILCNGNINVEPKFGEVYLPTGYCEIKTHKFNTDLNWGFN